MVLIREDGCSRQQWPLAVVTKLFPCKDGLVRAIKLKTAKSIVMRPIQRLHCLELSNDADNGDKVEPSVSERVTILTPFVTSVEIDKSISNLTNEEKLLLLENRENMPSDFVYPKTYTGGCNSFKNSWLSEHQWIMLFVFCLLSLLFSSKKDKMCKFIYKPFKTWQKKTEYC